MDSGRPAENSPSTSITVEGSSRNTSISDGSTLIGSSSHANLANHNRTPSLGSQKDVPFLKRAERNLLYLKDQLEQFCATRTGPGASAFVPIVCGSILLLYLVNLLSRHEIKEDSKRGEIDPAFAENVPLLVKWFTLTPGYVLSPRHWIWSIVSMITYPFIELYFYQVVLDVVVVSLSTTLIEPLWGKRELVTFFAVINVSVAIFTMVHYTIIYTVKGDAVYLYGVKIYGLTGYLAAICVTVKQLLPDSVLISTSLGKMKNDNVPLAALSVSLLLYLFNLTSGVSVITFSYGLISSWIYLRFFQFHPTNGTRGDMSDSFAFATFFPNVLQPLVSLICDTVYSFLVRIKFCPEHESRQYQSVRVLSERLTDNFRLPVRNKHKYHPSGDYQHLHSPRVETL